MNYGWVIPRLKKLVLLISRDCLMRILEMFRLKLRLSVTDICSSPKLFAAYHVFHRLLVPRHPPCALISLTTARVHSVGRFGFQLVSLFPYILLYGLGCLLFNNSFNMRFSRYVLYVRSTVHAFSPFRFTDQWRWRDSNS